MAEATTPARAAGPDSPPAQADRLKAAEDATGFKLNQRVLVKGSNHGVLSVVGFAQVNPPGFANLICCVVAAVPDHLREQGPEACILYTPDRLKPAPEAA